MGSKRRIAKEILPIIIKDRAPGQWYVEPFVGGFNMIEHVDGNRIGNDINPYLIAMFSALLSGWDPPKHVSEEEYADIRKNKGNYPPELVGYVGFNSFGAKFFGGYCREKTGKTDFWKSHLANLQKQLPKLRGIVLENKNYWELEIPDNSIVYCDPPYFGTTQYRDGIDHTFFWEWIRGLHKAGHTVFVSEYTAPDDFKSIWSKTIETNISKDVKNLKRTEHLFVFK